MLLKRGRKIVIGLLLLSLPLVFLVKFFSARKKTVHFSEAQENISLSPPILFAYGFSDGSEPYRFIGTNAYQTVKVIEGWTGKSPQYFAEKGVVFAYHAKAIPDRSRCGNDVDKCAEQLMNNYRKVIGKGFPAIALDEYVFSNVVTNRAQKKALEKLRSEYPHLYIFVWGASHAYRYENYSPEVKQSIIDLLRTIKDEADYFLVEVYLPETTALEDKLARFDEALTAINQAVPGILEKTLVGIGAADTEDYTYDLNPGVDFKEFLDEEFYYLRHHSLGKRTKGIAVYSYARSRPDTIEWIQNLFRHYFLEGKTSYYSSEGINLNFLHNPGFEQGYDFWNVKRSKDSYAYITSYGWLSGRGYTILSPSKKYIRVPEPYRGTCNIPSGRMLYLYKWRGEGTEASQTVSLKKNTEYVLTAYGTLLPLKEGAIAPFDVVVEGSQELKDSVRKETFLFSSKNYTLCKKGKDFSWTRLTVYFKTGEENSVTIKITDKKAPSGTRMIVDFVQLEEARGWRPGRLPLPSPPTPTPTPPYRLVCEPGCYFGASQCKTRVSPKPGYSCVYNENCPMCDPSTKYWCWSYCKKVFFASPSPTPVVSATPTAMPTATPVPAISCESKCHFGVYQCKRDNAGKSGGRCMINPNCPGVPDDNYQSYWRWSYCYVNSSSPTPIPLTPTATPTPKPTASPVSCQGGCFYSGYQCAWRVSPLPGYRCTKAPSYCKGCNEATGEWCWAYCK